MQPWRLDELNYGQVKTNPPYRGRGASLRRDRASQPPSSLRHRHVPGRSHRPAGMRPGAPRRGPGAAAPGLPYGTETNQMKFPLAMNLNPTTVARVIADLVDSLAAHGVMRCVLLNGHGGNDLKWVLRELHCKTSVHIFLCNWYKVASDVYPTIFEEKDDHAGEMETSMGLAHFPRLVALEQADSGAVRPSRFEAINRGWIEITRPWHLLTTNSGSGDPRAATACQRRNPHRPGRRPDRPVPRGSSPKARWTRAFPFEILHSHVGRSGRT